jgi:hypothetical protein
MGDWRNYGTIRKHDIYKTMNNPFDFSDFREDVERTLDMMLRENDPPNVRATLDRLLGLELREDYARYLMSCVVAAEIIANAEAGPTEGWDRLMSRLAILPETPWIVADH